MLQLKLKVSIFHLTERVELSTINVGKFWSEGQRLIADGTL